MNIREYDILRTLKEIPCINQRDLAESSGYSLGAVNKSLKILIKENYINSEYLLLEKAVDEFVKNAPQRAIILAAGFGMRMVPINTEVSKGMLEINGEPLIERIIRQLHEVGIKEIYIVVGFMKEQYEYLIDDFGVQLIVNEEYAKKNNLYSLKLAIEYMENAYIIPCDLWCKENPFRRHELYSWYMVSEKNDYESTVRVNRKMELVPSKHSPDGNHMIGICYLNSKDASIIKKNVLELSAESKNDSCFWETALCDEKKIIVAARLVPENMIVEINTYEQLREIDGNSNQLKSEVIHLLCDIFKVQTDEIYNITVLKKGMTNRSFLFWCKNKKYIMRIPGEGTDRLIDRYQEAEVYDKIKNQGICDDIVYIDSVNGYKVTEFFEDARVCNPNNKDDVKRCMSKLKAFHDLKLKVDHQFNIFDQIQFYERLWNGKPSIYKDYERTKKNIFQLKFYIEKHRVEEVLTHIDANPDNFLFTVVDGKEEIRLIDWEYAGMQDPHVDIAMFGIYSMYERKQMDQLIDFYFENHCNRSTRIKIYCYIAICGLLWSNWCEYKRNLGIEFGEYSLRQYRYAKEYYRIVEEELTNNA